MEVELPTTGCNIFYGTYIDNYSSDSRTRDRYYINEGKLVLNTSQYNQYGYSLPSGYHCVSTGDIVYKPELEVYIPFLAMILIVFALFLVYRVIIKRLLP